VKRFAHFPSKLLTFNAKIGYKQNIFPKGQRFYIAKKQILIILFLGEGKRVGHKGKEKKGCFDKRRIGLEAVKFVRYGFGSLNLKTSLRGFIIWD